MSLVKNSSLSFDKIEKLVKSVSWYHSVEILPNIVAPGSLPKNGRYDVDSLVDFVIQYSDGLNGKRILEIGTWDGPLAYKLNSLGYDVTASDIQNPEKTGFNVTGEITGLNVSYVRCSVYELPKYFGEEFDIVLFFGVFYHLKYPILAFERISQILKPKGRLLFMGSGVSHNFETLDGQQIPLEYVSEFSSTLARMDELGIPLCLSYPGNYLRGDNWFLPNCKALEGWINAAGLSVGSLSGTPNDWGCLHLRGWAQKINNHMCIEHGLVGENGGYTSNLD